MKSINFAKTVSAVVDNVMDQLTGDQFKVYMLLIRMTDVNNQCYPTLEYISEKTGKTPQYVSKTVNYLANIGLIQIGKKMYFEDGKPRCKNTYTVTVLNDEPVKKVEDEQVELVPEKKYNRDDWYICAGDDEEYMESKKEKVKRKIRGYKKIAVMKKEEVVEEVKKLSDDDKDLLGMLVSGFRRVEKDKKEVELHDKYYYKRMRCSELKKEIVRLANIVDNEEEGFEEEIKNLSTARMVFAEEY